MGVKAFRPPGDCSQVEFEEEILFTKAKHYNELKRTLAAVFNDLCCVVPDVVISYNPRLYRRVRRQLGIKQ